MGTQHEPIDYPSRPKPRKPADARGRARNTRMLDRALEKLTKLVPRAKQAARRYPKSKAAGRRLVLEAQAQEDLLVAANVALAELERMDGLAAEGRFRCRRGPYLGLRNALWHLDALDE